MKRAEIVWALGFFLVGQPSSWVAAHAAQPEERFALIIGVNRSLDAAVPSLKYADDDAARYADLFRALGTSVHLLTRFDENTRRLAPADLGSATLPNSAGLRRELKWLAEQVATAHAHHARATVYFVYAGHGNVDDGRGYLALEDQRLYGDEMVNKILDQVAADQWHFIVDACYSYALVGGRGPGGMRRPVHGFAGGNGLGSRPNVGLLLSTSTAKESHEWSGFQAGIFSHEVRSGLYGAADANNDGLITYSEIGAFVLQANAAVPNERFRPDVFAMPAAQDDVLADLRPALARRIEISGSTPVRYALEDSNGVPLADLHIDFSRVEGHRISLVHPPGSVRLYLRRIPDDQEYVVESTEAVRIADLVPHPASAAPRGAAADAFRHLFTVPFSADTVSEFVVQSVHPATLDAPASSGRKLRTVLLAVAVAGAATGGALLWSAHDLRADGQSATSQEAAAINSRIEVRNRLAGAAFTAAALGAATTAILTFWPSENGPRLSLEKGRLAVGFRGRF